MSMECIEDEKFNAIIARLAAFTRSIDEIPFLKNILLVSGFALHRQLRTLLFIDMIRALGRSAQDLYDTIRGVGPVANRDFDDRTTL